MRACFAIHLPCVFVCCVLGASRILHNVQRGVCVCRACARAAGVGDISLGVRYSSGSASMFQMFILPIGIYYAQFQIMRYVITLLSVQFHHRSLAALSYYHS